MAGDLGGHGRGRTGGGHGWETSTSQWLETWVDMAGPECRLRLLVHHESSQWLETWVDMAGCRGCMQRGYASSSQWLETWVDMAGFPAGSRRCDCTGVAMAGDLGGHGRTTDKGLPTGIPLVAMAGDLGGHGRVNTKTCLGKSLLGRNGWRPGWTWQALRPPGSSTGPTSSQWLETWVDMAGPLSTPVPRPPHLVAMAGDLGGHGRTRTRVPSS